MGILFPSSEISWISGRHRKTPVTIISNTGPRYVNSSTALRINCNKSKLPGKICARIKDVEPRVMNSEHCDMKLDGQFSAAVEQVSPSSSKRSKEEEEKQNYHVHTGYAIRFLREEFPELFYRELTFDVYRDDIVFKDPLNTFVGIENYKSIYWGLRFHGKMFFKALWIDIVSVWQPVENMIMVRWTVHGIPRVPWESRGRFDGTSEYKLDEHGKIYMHRVHNIALNMPPKFRVLAVDELIQSLGCPSTPKPTYFESSASLTRESCHHQ
ncbi:hypothetical protein RJ639_043625 [Escallonia herrerae]|uniref:Uncharacterized protein n=1 Tax=Escallonia herrerae TaxID=1293975 RepID=A0AA88WCM6_9ASTE|nr:hypothetical protein RJ639_043625 [Escallonia herrerae]